MQDMKLVESLNDLRREIKSDLARHERETRKDMRELRNHFLRAIVLLALALGGVQVLSWVVK